MAERYDRGDRRQGLLQGRGDRRLRAGWHRRHGLKAEHFERGSGRAVSTKPTSSMIARTMPIAVRPAEWLTYHFTNEHDGKTMRSYWTNDVRDLRDQAQVHHRQGTPRSPLGA